MKKLVVALLLAALVALSLTALAEGGWYVDEGAALIRRVQTLARDEYYCQAFMVLNEKTQDCLDKLNEAEFGAPVSAKALYIGGRDELLAMLERVAPMMGDSSLDVISKMSDVAKEELSRRLVGSLLNMLAAHVGGDTWIMMGSFLNTSETCAEPEEFRPCMLLADYGNGFEACFHFQRVVDGTVSASITLLPPGASAFADDFLSQLKAYGVELETEALVSAP